MQMIEALRAALSDLEPIAFGATLRFSIGPAAWIAIDEAALPPLAGLRAALALRRGQTLTSTVSIQINLDEEAGALPLRTVSMPFPVPVPYQGVVIVDGEAYEKDRYARAYASRATTAFRAFWTLVADGVARVDPTTTSESLDEIDNILSILDESLDTIDIQDLLRASEPPSRLPRQPRADFDARVIQTRSGGVLLWPLDGLLSHVRAYVMLDDEQISGERATLRAGDPIFTTVSQQIAVLEGTTVAVGIEVGAWVENGTVIAVVDGAPVVSSAAGRVLRIEHVGAEHDELRAAGIVEARADFLRDAYAFLEGRAAPCRIVDDNAKVIFPKGSPVSFATPPSMRVLTEVLSVFDEATALQQRGVDLEHLDPLAALSGPGGHAPSESPWLQVTNTPHATRIRIVLAP